MLIAALQGLAAGLLGLIAANFGEWAVHRWVLHGLGKRRGTWWAFHFHEHHSACRRHHFFDPDYERSPFGLHAQGKEVLGLVLSALFWAPWGLLYPAFIWGVLTSHLYYFLVHRRAHLDPDWGRRYLPWHYDHHMGPNQDSNWCVSFPLADLVLGTRNPYLGTERAEADEARRRARAAARG